ncbi:MAG: hypothetical protein ACRCUK_13760 [Plesiomonas shigelloides]
MNKDSICFKCKRNDKCDLDGFKAAKALNLAMFQCKRFETKEGMCRDCYEVRELNNGLCMYCELEERRMETKAIMLAVLAIVVGLSVKFLVG